MTDICTHETTITIKIWNISITPKGFIMPHYNYTSPGKHSYFLPLCVFSRILYERAPTGYTVCFFFFSFGLASVIQPSAFETHRVVTCIRSFYLFITDWLCCCTACNFLHKMSREQQNHTEIQMPGTSCIHLTHGACDLNSALNIIIYFHKS